MPARQLHSSFDPGTQPVPMYQPTKPKVAVIGGGMAGLSCARALHEAGLAVTVFDKGRGAGGRMSTRRSGRSHFDHGAQYFTVRDQRFDARVQMWREAGVVAPWQGRLTSLPKVFFSRTPSMIHRFVGVPGMSAVLRHFAEDLDMRFSTRVTGLSYEQDHWWIDTADGPVDDFFVATVVAVPAPQAVPLLAATPHLQTQVAEVEMDPTWAVMAAFEQRLDVAYDGAFVDTSPLSWVARNNSKPGRPETDAWVLHATAEWSREHVNASPDQVTTQLLDAFGRAADLTLPNLKSVQAHRWLYARTSQPLNKPCLFEASMSLGVCGDWCPGARVEGAFLSGLAVADHLIDHLPMPNEEQPSALADS